MLVSKHQFANAGSQSQMYRETAGSPVNQYLRTTFDQGCTTPCSACSGIPSRTAVDTCHARHRTQLLAACYQHLGASEHGESLPDTSTKKEEIGTCLTNLGSTH